MKRLPILLFFIFLQQIVVAQSYKKIHQNAILVDTHNDILMKVVDQGVVFDQDLIGKTHTDLNRWKKGGLDVQFFSVYCDGDTKNSYIYANRAMDSLDAVVARNPSKIAKVANYKELVQAVKQGKIAAMCGVEGGHMIDNNLSNLEALYNRGARYLTLTHNVAPNWATSAADEVTNPNLSHKGLTDFGKNVVQRMNELGMMVDVSHVGEQTFWDVIQLSKKPIIASHSSVYALMPHRRNLKDEQIKAIAKNGGVIQVNFYPGFLDPNFNDKENTFLKRHQSEMDALKKTGLADYYLLDAMYAKYPDETQALRPALSVLIDHIEYIIKLVGVDYVGLGSDFDGIHLTPKELDDVTTYPLITKSLVEKGYSKKDIDKILGGNLLRVLKANEE